MADTDAGPLQFDRVIETRDTGNTRDAGLESIGVGMTCAGCSRAISTDYYDVNGQTLCESCRDAVELAASTSGGLVRFAMAVAFGLGAAIAGAIVYYAVIAFLDLEIGIIAILCGYMVGYAVRAGAGKRGGRRFQIAAVLLTYLSVAFAYTPLAIQGAVEAARAEQTSASPDADAPGITSDATVIATPPAPGAPGDASVVTSPAVSIEAPPGLVRTLATVAILVVTLPLFVVFGSFPSGLISAAIIIFGILQAWRMTAAPYLQISGPYRVAVAPSSACN